nr:thiamine transporter 2-like isoform X2 [Paramormyrops kingsleyae]
MASLRTMEIITRFQEEWKYHTTLLCIYGFFSTVKPLEPFLIPYLTGPNMNFTTEQVNNQIFPVWTYSYLVVLLPVFLLTDYLRYKPVIMLQCVSLWATSGLLLWSHGVASMQVMQFFYGMVTACDVAYFSYIYSVVEPQYYQKVTAYCRSVQLLGYTVGSVLGQLLVSFNLMSYHEILVLNLVLISIALATSFLLPMPQKSMFFHRQQGKDEQITQCGASTNSNGVQTMDIMNSDQVVSSKSSTGKDSTKEEQVHKGNFDRNNRLEVCDNVTVNDNTGHTSVLLQLWRDFLKCYSRQLLCWSLWWALATCGYNQTVNYVQVLWEHVQPSQNFTIYNGGVEAASNLFGAAAAYTVSFINVNWSTWGELALGSFSGLGAGVLFLMTFAGNIWVCYASYVTFKFLYMLLITIAMFQIAADLSVERYALIFGANTFCALVLQTIITVVVVDSKGLGLNIISQFIVYGTYFSIIALLFLVRGIYTAVSRSHTVHPLCEEEAQPNRDTCHITSSAIK